MLSLGNRSKTPPQIICTTCLLPRKPYLLKRSMTSGTWCSGSGWRGYLHDGRYAPAAARKAELYVNSQSHGEIYHCGPETVVVGGGISVAGWKGIDGNGFESQVGAML